jgi:hypothetical protein
MYQDWKMQDFRVVATIDDIFADIRDAVETMTDGPEKTYCQTSFAQTRTYFDKHYAATSAVSDVSVRRAFSYMRGLTEKIYDGVSVKNKTAKQVAEFLNSYAFTKSHPQYPPRPWRDEMKVEYLEEYYQKAPVTLKLAKLKRMAATAESMQAYIRSDSTTTDSTTTMAATAESMQAAMSKLLTDLCGLDLQSGKYEVLLSRIETEWWKDYAQNKYKLRGQLASLVLHGKYERAMNCLTTLLQKGGQKMRDEAVELGLDVVANDIEEYCRVAGVSLGAAKEHEGGAFDSTARADMRAMRGLLAEMGALSWRVPEIIP